MIKYGHEKIGSNMRGENVSRSRGMNKLLHVRDSRYEWIGIPLFTLMIVSAYKVSIKSRFLCRVISYLSSISYAFFWHSFLHGQLQDL